MKKFVSTIVSSSLLTLPTIGLAQVGAAPTVDVLRALDDITNWLFAILLIVAVIYLIIAGYFFITAMGDPDKVSKARMMVLWSMVGVLVAVAAKGLVMLVRRMVGTS